MSHDRAPGSPAGPQSWPDDTEFHLPEDHWPLPELVHTEKPHAEPSGEAFREVAAAPEYATLRSTFRGFAFPMTIAGLVSYFVFVVLSIYAVDFMKQPFLGMKGLTLGFVLALVQFAVVWIWTALYVNFANKRIDPIAGQLKARLENGTRA